MDDNSKDLVKRVVEDVKKTSITKATIQAALEVSDEVWEKSVGLRAIGGSTGENLNHLADYVFPILKEEFPDLFKE